MASTANESENRLLVAFVLPLFLYLVLNAIEPQFVSSPSADELAAEATVDASTSEPNQKPVDDRRGFDIVGFCVVKSVLVGSVLIYFWPIYRRHLPWRLSAWALVVGAVGAVVWIFICWLAWEQALLVSLGLHESLLGSRAAVNPFAAIAEGTARVVFLAFRFLLLVVLVPIVEELFLRGFLMRYLQNPDWLTVQFNQLSFWPLASAAAYGVITHPAEALAAAIWFSLVTWLMVRTNSIWNCVIAHAVTNALLGVYVLRFQQWQLW